MLYQVPLKGSIRITIRVTIRALRVQCLVLYRVPLKGSIDYRKGCY